MNISKIWEYFNGKKRTIACYYWVIVMPCLLILYPNGAPIWLNKTTAIVGTILSATGLGHMWAKSVTAKKEQEQISQDTSDAK